MKKESEYAQILSNIANDLNIRNSRKKSLETRENLAKHLKNEEDNNFKNHLKKIRSEQIESQNENLQEKLQNLQYKFQKLEEFTEQNNVETFCKKFKKKCSKKFRFIFNDKYDKQTSKAIGKRNKRFRR